VRPRAVRGFVAAAVCALLFRIPSRCSDEVAQTKSGSFINEELCVEEECKTEVTTLLGITKTANLPAYNESLRKKQVLSATELKNLNHFS